MSIMQKTKLTGMFLTLPAALLWLNLDGYTWVPDNGLIKPTGFPDPFTIKCHIIWIPWNKHEDILYDMMYDSNVSIYCDLSKYFVYI